MASILVVDAHDGESIRVLLKKHRHSASVVSTAADALLALSVQWPDLIVMDHVLPDMSGLLLQPTIGRIPLILVSADEDKRTRVVALRGGADDFIGKPWDDDELVERVTVVLRRTYRERMSTAVTVGQLVIDYGAVRFAGRAIQLTKTEYAILTHLTQQVNKIVSQNDLSWAVYGVTEGANWAAILTSVWRLRAKLNGVGMNNPAIETIRGMGLRLSYA
jgi:DNA-binding response OmpR family regulator